MTIFGSLEMGRTALMAQYKGVQVTGQNIANANTPGYTRQRVEMEAIVPGIANNNKLAPGHGVLVKDIVRINTEFFHKQIVENNAFKATWDVLLGAYRGLENIFMEPGDEGFNHYIEEFFDTWHDLAAAPESIAVRMSLREMVYGFTSMVQDNYKRTNDLRDDYVKELQLAVDDVNSLLSEVARINEKLMLINASNEKSNELMDQMDLTLKELGNYIDMRFYKQANGAVDVYSEGRLLVSDDMAYPINLQLEINDPSYPAGIKEVVFTNSKDGEKALVVSGDAAKGYQLVINGNGDTDYTLGTGNLKFNDPAATDMAVYIKTFTDAKDNDIKGTLRDYYDARFDPEDANYAANMAALDNILNGTTELYNIAANGTMTWASIDGVSLEIKGDYPLGTFTFNSLVDTGVTGEFDLEIRDTVDVSNMYQDYKIVNHSGVDLSFKYGRLTGLLETVNYAIPSTQQDMNEIINRLVVEVNNIHRESFGLDIVEGEEHESAGNFFYDIEDNGIPPALQFAMVQELFDDPRLIGAASANNEPGNAGKALEMAQLRQQKLMADGTATVSEYYRALTTSVAVKGRESQQLVNVYERTGAKLKEESDAITGVNLDEEMINLIQFQNAWQAAAKFINYIDEMLAILLNMGHR